MSSEPGLPDIKIDPDLESEVEEKVHEILVEDLAYARALEDPRFRESMVARKTAEADAESAGRMRAVDVDQRRKRRAVNYDRYPWGIDYLRGDHSPEAIFERLSAPGEEGEGTVHHVDDETNAKREQDLNEAVEEARRLTLDLGQMTADKLAGAGVPTDAKITIEHTHHMKGFSGHNLRVHGKIRGDIPFNTHEDIAEGWVLPINGQIDRFAKVVLCEDGRILVAYPIPKKEDEEKGKTRFYVEPNRPATKDTPPNIFSSYIDEHTESDIGMSSLQANSSIGRTHSILMREQDLQEAIVSMLVENDIPITSEQRTVEEPEPEELPLPEQIDKWFDEGLVTLHTWIGDNSLPEKNSEPHARNRFMNVYNNRRVAAASNEDVRTPEELERAFQDAGVDELLTYSFTNKQMKGEHAVKVSYEIPEGSYPEMSGFHGNTLRMHMLLPESEAQKLWDTVARDPKIAGQVAERFMVDYLGLEEWWKMQHPDLEKNREKRGGKRRMAFRSGFSNKPEESAIKEF